MSYISHVVDQNNKSNNFREVLFTGQKSQLVIMNIPVGGEIGEETHAHVEQTLFVIQGNGKAVLDGKETLLDAGDVVVVTPGTRHNIVNVGTGDMKITTIYAPANHIDARIHATKADADADKEDEAFGEAVI